MQLKTIFFIHNELLEQFERTFAWIILAVDLLCISTDYMHRANVHSLPMMLKTWLLPGLRNKTFTPANAKKNIAFRFSGNHVSELRVLVLCFKIYQTTVLLALRQVLIFAKHFCEQFSARYNKFRFFFKIDKFWNQVFSFIRQRSEVRRSGIF